MNRSGYCRVVSLFKPPVSVALLAGENAILQKSERAGGRLLVCCWELLRIRSSPSRATGVRPYKKCAVSSLPWPLNAVLAVFPRIEAVDPSGYRIHRDPHAGAVPIRRMVNVTHPPRTAHSGPRAESACLTVVPLRDHVQINRIPRDFGVGTVVTAWPFSGQSVPGKHPPVEVISK